MKKLKFGETGTGLILGGILVALGALVMLIGFWRVLILVCLFGVGYFIGTVDNKEDFFKGRNCTGTGTGPDSAENGIQF